MKKIFKIILILIMLIGVGFSIANFTSVKLQADYDYWGVLFPWPLWDCIPPAADCHAYVFEY